MQYIFDDKNQFLMLHMNYTIDDWIYHTIYYVVRNHKYKQLFHRLLTLLFSRAVDRSTIQFWDATNLEVLLTKGYCNEGLVTSDSQKT